MVCTRSKARSEARRLAFNQSYKNLTPAQQIIKRHNRFLARMWKTPRDKRQQHRTCVACLEDFLTGPRRGPMMIMACDHPIHMDCFEQHASAYMDSQNLAFSEEVDALPMHVVNDVFKKRYISCVAVAHAPPAACRFRCGICACLSEISCVNDTGRGPGLFSRHDHTKFQSCRTKFQNLFIET